MIKIEIIASNSQGKVILKNTIYEQNDLITTLKQNNQNTRSAIKKNLH